MSMQHALCGGGGGIVLMLVKLYADEWEGRCLSWCNLCQLLMGNRSSEVVTGGKHQIVEDDLSLLTSNLLGQSLLSMSPKNTSSIHHVFRRLLVQNFSHFANRRHCFQPLGSD